MVTGTWILYDKFDKYKVTLKGYGHSDSVLLLMLRFILKIFKHYSVLFSETSKRFIQVLQNIVAFVEGNFGQSIQEWTK